MAAKRYYNEHDPFAAAWLRELIAWNMIAPGDVDERSIEDVCADDLRGYVQHHFFAGIGVWSAALRGAGWPDDRPVWTGSCPCQPFSAAGKGGGFADERHLWPTWHWLIRQHRPDVVFGEQVASRPGLEWFDLVSSDLEGEGYAVGAADLGAASVGAPHIRQRLWFVAHHHHQRRDGRGLGSGTAGWGIAADSSSGHLVDPDGWDAGAEGLQRSGQHGQQQEDGRPGGLVDAAGEQTRLPRCAWFDGRPSGWIPCRDGKWRPVEPGTFPLAHGAPARVGLLRGYGNALVKPVAEAFIAAAMTVLP